MDSFNLPLRKRAWAYNLELTPLRGVYSMNFNRDLGIAQSSTCHMLHRIREGLFPELLEVFEQPIEVDESYIGEKELNKREDN